MPTIFFVRDGTGDHRTSAGHHVPMTAVSGMSAHFPARFRASGPNINPAGVASAFAAYQHVVMEVEAGESNAEYPQPGFYYFVGMSPAQAKDRFGFGPQ